MRNIIFYFYSLVEIVLYMLFGTNILHINLVDLAWQNYKVPFIVFLILDLALFIYLCPKESNYAYKKLDKVWTLWLLLGIFGAHRYYTYGGLSPIGIIMTLFTLISLLYPPFSILFLISFVIWIYDFIYLLLFTLSVINN